MDIGIKNKEYEIIKEIGKGGMSSVYLAKEPSLNRFVAIKVLHPNISKNERNKERLRREALAIAKTNHINIVEIFKFIEEENSYIVMEYVDGDNLDDFIQEHPIHFVEIALSIFLKISKAIAHAHSKGIIHRDIKPENVMLSKDGEIKVMDFGISSIIGENHNLTTTGSIMGSPMFMSPEHLSDEKIDRQSDIFSLGIVLYNLLTRDYPFKGKNTGQLLRNIASCSYESAQIKNKLIPNAVNQIIKKALVKEKIFRYQKVNEIVKDIGDYFKSIDFNPDKEIIEFFKNPEKYQADFSKKISTLYIEKAKKAFKNRKYSIATECSSLVLEYPYNNEEALKIIKKIEKNRLVKKIIPISLIFIVLILFLIYFTNKIHKNSNNFTIKQEKNIKENYLKIRTDYLLKTDLNKNLNKNLKKEIKKIKRKIKIQKQFEKPIRIFPKAASIFLNDKHYAYANINHIKLKTNKKYKLVVKSKACETKIINLFFRKINKTPLAIRLKWKNAILNIKNNKKYDIYINDKYKGNFKNINFFKRPNEFSNGRIRIELKIMSKNNLISKENIELIAGKKVERIIK